jgi:hypothetical protein
MNLKEKLESDLAAGKGISSADIAAFSTKPPEIGTPVQGDVKVKVPDEAKKDPVLETAAAGEPGPRLAGLAKNAADADPTKGPVNDPYMVVPEEVVITETEREAFLNALIVGSRFELPFELFKGKIKGKLRCRSQQESTAIIARLTYELDLKTIVNGLDYSTRLRNMLMAAQVAELNGTCYPTLSEPLMRTINGKDVKEPGWLEQAVYWGTLSEGLVSAVYKQVRIFEAKYWIMVNNAANQNFWNPAGSTSK